MAKLSSIHFPSAFNTVVEHTLHMHKVPGSVPDINNGGFSESRTGPLRSQSDAAKQKQPYLEKWGRKWVGQPQQPKAQHHFSVSLTSVWIFGTEPVSPFSVMALLELFGELGPDPGALLHIEDTVSRGKKKGGCQYVRLCTHVLERIESRDDGKNSRFHFEVKSSFRSPGQL